MSSGYNEALAKLMKRVRQIHVNHGAANVTTKKRELEEIATQLDKVIEVLERQGTAQSDIEELHDRPPPPAVGFDGYPVAVDDYGASYKGTIGYMRDLADSARRAANEMPDSRAKHALPFAALALLHIRYQHGFPRPAISVTSDDVVELKRVTTEAGIVLSDGRLSNALGAALREFDPHLLPYHIRELLD